MSKSNFELAYSNAFAPRAKAITEPELVEARLQELSSDLVISLLNNAIHSGLVHETTPLQLLPQLQQVCSNG